MRGLEQRAGDDLEPALAYQPAVLIGAAVVAVLAHLGDELAGLAAEATLGRHDARQQVLPTCVLIVRSAIDTANRGWVGSVAPEHILHRRRDFAERRAGTGAFHREPEQVFLAPRALTQRIERGLTYRLVAPRLDLRDPRDLRLAHRVVVDIEDVELGVLGQPVFVDPDDHILAAIDARLLRRGGFLDHRLGP